MKIKLIILIISILILNKSYAGNTNSNKNIFLKSSRLCTIENKILKNPNDYNKILYNNTVLSNSGCKYEKLTSNYELGKMYFFGKNIQQNFNIALEYFLSMFDDSFFDKEIKLLTMFFIGFIYLKKFKLVKAIPFLKKAAFKNSNTSLRDACNYLLSKIYFIRYKKEHITYYQYAIKYVNKVIYEDGHLKEAALDLKKIIESDKN